MAHVRGADIFAGIKQTAIMISTGPVEVPVLYRDGSMLVIGYRTDPVPVQSILHGLPIDPFLILGRALVLLVLAEYRDTSIGAYNEIGILILVRRAGTEPSLWGIFRDVRKIEDVGLYVTNLPVTTQVALTGGIEVYGFPKYAAEIETSFQPHGVQVTLKNEFVLSHSPGFGLEMDGLPIITYTLLKNMLIRTIIEVGHRVRFGGASTVQMRIIGDGPTAATAKGLGLDVVRPAFAFRTDAMKAVLPLGKNLGPAES
jgi:hypothetical protein